jgi:hypothetical protein
VSRNLVPEVIKRFKGLRSWDSVALCPPDYALDCANVIPSGSGGLEKLRCPKTLAAAIGDLVGNGNIFNFQSALGIRQVLAGVGRYLYRFALDGYTPSLISSDPLNSGILSVVQSNNIAFIANGLRMMKWTGTNFQNWGIAKPAAPGVIDSALSNPAVAPVVGESALPPIPDPVMIPILGETSGGALALRTYSASITFIGPNAGETMESPAAVSLVDANFVAVVQPVDTISGTIGWNCYVDILGNGVRTKQNTLVIPIGIQCFEPLTGFTNTGAAPPGASTAGYFPLRNYSVSYTFVSVNGGETAESPVTVAAISANAEAVISAPAAISGATGWNCYVDILGGAARTKQNGAVIPFGSPITEPITGFTNTGDLSPGVNRTGADVVITDPAVPPVCAGFYKGEGIARTYSITYTLVDSHGETLESPAATLALADGEWATITAPASVPGTIGWNCYVDPAGGATRYRVNGDTPLAFAGNYVEPDPWGFYFHDLDPVPPIANTTGGKGIAVVMGWRYRVAAGNSVTGHIGAASEPSPSTGASTAKVMGVGIANPTDAQCDQLWLFRTQDGGADYYLRPNPATADGSYPLTPGGGTVLWDDMVDADLDTAIIAPLINLPPPVGRYLSLWKGQGRIFIFNLLGAPQDIAYSGYERIFIGRPEETFPPNNRLRLAIGSDEIRGGGVIQAGIVVFSKSNEMFMFKGGVEDIVTDQPPAFAAVLEQLPWNTGCASHYSIVSTPYGLVWLASDKTIKIFSGTDKPRTLGGDILPLLRRITPGTEQDARSIFFCFLEREWYLMLCAVDGSITKNCIIIVDLDPDETANVGGFPLFVEADAMELVEDENGINHVVLLQNGAMVELTVLSDTTGGISLVYAATANLLPAHWRGGYVGNDGPQVYKLFRWANLVTDQSGFRLQGYSVNDENSTFRDPEILPFVSVNHKHTINHKTRRLSLEIQFPDEDVAANVLELSILSIPTSER